MAVDVREDYRKAGTYKRADSATRRRYDAWKADQNITDAQMCLLLRLQDLRDAPKDEKKKGNKTPETLLVLSMFFFLLAMNNKNVLMVASVIVIINTVIYLSGILNPISNAMRKLKKELKKYPEIVPFKKWCEEHEGK